MEAVPFPRKAVFVDGNTLRNAIVEKPRINLVKEGIFEFWSVFEMVRIPELEKKRCGRICARKRCREFRIERIRLRREKKRTTAVPDGAPATEATVRFGNLGIDLGADLCDIEFTSQNHLVEGLYVGKRHFPFKWGIFKPMEQSFVDEGVVWASGNTKRELHKNTEN
jgi:hypothetical protein